MQNRYMDVGDVNRVALRGTIRRKFRHGDDWLVLAIVTTPVGGRRDVPSIYWYGENIDMVDKAFNTGDHVEIEAYIATSKKYKTMTVVGVDINNTPRELEIKFGIGDAGRYLGDVNEVCLKGSLLHTYTPEPSKDPITIATIKTVKDGRIAFPQVAFFGRQMQKIQQVHPGDEVCIVGHLQTRRERNPEDNSQIFRQTIVCHYTK